MRRRPHPAQPHPARLNRPQQTALAAAGLTLVVAVATGALHSPFLLLLPMAVALAALRFSPGGGAALIAAVGALLVAGEALLDALRWWEAGAALAAVAALVWLDSRVRRWLRRGVLADRVGLRLPTPQVPVAPPDELAALQEQLAQLREGTQADAVVLWEAGPQRARAIVAAGRSLPPSMAVEGDALGWVAREGTPLRLERTPPWAADGNQVIAARIAASADVAWLLSYEYLPGRTTPPHQLLAGHGAPVASLLSHLAGLRLARLDRERLAGLLELLRRIPLETELGAYGRELLDAAVRLTGATGGCLAAWSGEHGHVVARAGTDGGPSPGARFTAPRSELALAVRAGTPLVREAGRWRPGETQVATDDDEWLARPRALVSLPLLTPSGPTGAIALWSSRNASLDPAALELLGAALPFAALHLDHVLEYGRLRERADRDALTGLLNRRAFEAAFLAERLRFERYGRPLALLMIDIDHFKAINDTHGHQAGDEVLRSLARILTASVRDVDLAARFGGEEFVVLLPETNLAAAAEVAERIRRAVETTELAISGRPLAVRVSVGVSACPERAAIPAVLVGSADAALYQAKRDGRNRVVAAGAGPDGHG